MFRRTPLLLFILAALLARRTHSPPSRLARRLILKDGSYQLVTKYEVKGDRVRYKSAERNEWEELPSALVDWPATEKYEKDRATSPIPEAAALDKETDAEHEAELPTFLKSRPACASRMIPASSCSITFKASRNWSNCSRAEGDINRNTKANILRGTHSCGRRQANRRTRGRPRHRARPRRRAFHLHQCRG